MAVALRAFFTARWNGLVPLDRVAFVDMLLVGTFINIVMAIAGLLALGFKHPTWVAMAIYLSPLHYNVFLASSVWRGSAGRPAPVAAFYRLLAAAWLAIATLL